MAISPSVLSSPSVTSAFFHHLINHVVLPQSLLPVCVSHLAQGTHQLRRVMRAVESRGSQNFR